MYVEMTVSTFAIDNLAARPVVLLKDKADASVIPLWLTMVEALSMAADLMVWDSAGKSGRKDLLSLLMSGTGTSLEGIYIVGMKDGLCSSLIKLLQEDKEFSIEVPAAEAILAALKFKRPLLVAEQVVAQASVVGEGSEHVSRSNNERRFTDFLEKLDPSLLGKYMM